MSAGRRRRLVEGGRRRRDGSLRHSQIGSGGHAGTLSFGAPSSTGVEAYDDVLVSEIGSSGGQFGSGQSGSGAL